MAVKDSLLPEFDHEMALTRRTLERVPFEDAAWKPHVRSMSLGELASHLSDIPSWTDTLLRGAGYDMSGDPAAFELKYHDTAALVAAFDQNVRAARELVANTNDAQYMEPWTLKEKGRELFTQPRLATFRTFLLNHIVHHRGQLTVYLRLRNVPVPSVYGPSADER